MVPKIFREFQYLIDLLSKFNLLLYNFISIRVYFEYLHGRAKTYLCKSSGISYPICGLKMGKKEKQKMPILR